MRTIEKEAEIIYGKRKPNAEKTRMALVEEKKRMKRQIGCHSFGLITLCKTCNFTPDDESCQYVMKYFSKEPEFECIECAQKDENLEAESKTKTCPFCGADTVWTPVTKKVYTCTRCGAEGETLMRIKKEAKP